MNLKMDLTGKAAIVTGGARSLGKAYAEGLLQHGARVCIFDINSQTGLETEKEFAETFGSDQVYFRKCDVTNQADFAAAFDAAVKKFGSVEIVINNAGVVGENKWETVVDVNFKGVVRGTYLGVERMRKDKGGRGGTIVNIGSVRSFHPHCSGPMYSATKFAVLGFTAAIAGNPDHEDWGINFITFCPSYVDTPLLNYEEGAVFHPEMIYALKEKYGVSSVQDVAGALLNVVCENKNGAVAYFNKSNGLQYDTTTMEPRY